MHYAADGQQRLHDLGLTPEHIYRHGQLVCWRNLPERSNCTLDVTDSAGRAVRLHVKRLKRSHRRDALAEARGVELLTRAGIPTIPLLAWGRVDDGAVLISEDLYGYEPADRRYGQGLSAQALIAATAPLAARLHAAALHHRDLYLCHFFLADNAPPRLIDAARVRRLPRLLRRRWIIKDLAQLAYSADGLGLDDAWLARWLQAYVAALTPPPTNPAAAVAALLPAIARKRRTIAAHDKRLKRRQPKRNVSLSTTVETGQA